MTNLPEFSLKNPEVWKEGLLNNKDPYGFAVYRYAARFANFTERELAKGKKLEDVLDDTSHEADDEGITGFMYGCAVAMLSELWIHGEGLRRWHNLKTQVGDEGEEANESGGVLNPAIMVLKK